MLYTVVPLLLSLLIGIYLYIVFRRPLRLLFGKRGKILQRAGAAALAVLAALAVTNIWGIRAAIVLHFAAFSVLTDIVRMIWKKAGRRPGRIIRILYGSCGIALFLTGAVFCYAYINMHTVLKKEYSISTQKNIREEGYRLLFLSDLHFGTTMDQEKLAEYCLRMEAEKPDLVILGGDIVDEATTLSQIREVFSVLGQMDVPYGVYYVYGNHDKGRYSPECDFTPEQLAETIEECKITILEDETVQINGELTITGRRDLTDTRRSRTVRKSPETLLEDVPQAAFHILADHQPRGMEENAEAGYDLMLSGHTHAGQMWPVGLITSLFDGETVNYGQESFGDMELIVSSGIAGWGYPFRTGKHCEFVVVEVTI